MTTEQLFDAIKINDIDKVKEYIKRGVDINARDDDGWTALHYACLYDHPEIVDLLIEAKADVNARDDDGWTALFVAYLYGSCLKIVKKLINAGADIDARGKWNATVLHKAFIYNTPTLEGQSNVMKALKWKLYDFAKLLIERGEDINLKNIHERNEILRLLMPKCCYDEFTINIDQKDCCRHIKYVNIIKEKLKSQHIKKLKLKAQLVENYNNKNK